MRSDKISPRVIGEDHPTGISLRQSTVISALAFPAPLPYNPAMSQTTDGASLVEALEGFLGEHGRCWRVSGEDLALLEDRTVL